MTSFISSILNAVYRFFHQHDFEWKDIPADELAVKMADHHRICDSIETRYRAELKRPTGRPAPTPPSPSLIELRCRCGVKFFDQPKYLSR